jgi:hypothetical protein
MAAIIENKKNFKVIELSSEECREKIGGLGICDDCNEDFEKGFYVAVLNWCFCPKCYDNWMLKAVNYPEDHSFETSAFKIMQITLGIDKN